MLYTFDAAEAVKAAKVLKARTLIPNHFEGFTHFKQPQQETERVLAESDINVQWVLKGSTAEIVV
jgi:L-ascorbate metabolism protein UlaG (beta-lactamase superfamily)